MLNTEAELEGLSPLGICTPGVVCTPAVVCCHASTLLWSCGGNQSITGEAETTAQKQNQDRAIWSISGVLDIYSHHGFPSHVIEYMLQLAGVVLGTCCQETSY